MTYLLYALVVTFREISKNRLANNTDFFGGLTNIEILNGFVLREMVISEIIFQILVLINRVLRHNSFSFGFHCVGVLVFLTRQNDAELILIFHFLR